MRHFLKDILYVLLIGATIILAVEWLLLLLPNSYTYKSQYVENHKNDISVLLLGHSHTLHGVNPHVLGDSVFNFAESGRWIYYDAKIVERYVPLMPNLHTVIYPMAYDMPMGYLSYHYEEDHQFANGDNHEYNMYMYAKYMNMPYDRMPKRLLSYSAFLSGFFALDELTKDQLNCDSLGFEVLDYVVHWYEWENRHMPHLPDSILCDTSHTSVYMREYIDYLTDIAQVCQANNVRFVVITTPCHPHYLTKTCSAGIDNLYYVINEVAKHYPLEYFNYMDDPEFRADSVFLDCSHLNYIGADQFALRLKKDLGL